MELDNFIVNFNDFYNLRKKNWKSFDKFSELVEKMPLKEGLSLRVYHEREGYIEWHLFFETKDTCYVLPQAFMQGKRSKFLRACNGGLVDVGLDSMVCRNKIYKNFGMQNNVFTDTDKQVAYIKSRTMFTWQYLEKLNGNQITSFKGQ